MMTDVHHAALQKHFRNLRLIRVPNAAHSLQIVPSPMAANTVIHFIAAHDSITCHE